MWVRATLSYKSHSTLLSLLFTRSIFCCKPCKKEISDDLRSIIVDMHKVEKVDRVTTRTIRQTTVTYTVYKWRWFSKGSTLCRSGLSAKITPKAQHRLVKQVKRKPGVTAKGLKESLELVYISVQESNTQRGTVRTLYVLRDGLRYSKNNMLKLSSSSFIWSYVDNQHLNKHKYKQINPLNLPIKYVLECEGLN